MKVYKLEFHFFCGSVWRRVTVEVTATSMFQLMRTFLDHTKYLAQYMGRFNTRREAIKDLWNYSKEFIEETEIKFPIVNVA